MVACGKAILFSTSLLLVSCSGSGVGGSTPNLGRDLPAEMAFCRSRVDLPRDNEIALRTAQNLGTERVPNRSGREMHVAVHPLGDRVVFSRERDLGDPDSRELFVAGLDSTLPESRLTQNRDVDDAPCWSPNGDSVLFSTTRDGNRRLYITDAAGSNPVLFLSAGPSIDDRDPDWHAASDRIVFSRRDAAGFSRLFLLQGNGTGLVPLTTGVQAPTDDDGDRHPAFHPDGTHVVFVRRTSSETASLMEIDVATQTERPLLLPRGASGTPPGLGMLAFPRFSPTADRIFVGLAEPDLGRQTVRLSVVDRDGNNPLLVEPGEQWQLFGFDVLPEMAARPVGLPSEIVSIDDAELQVSSGFVVQGNRAMLRSPDNQSLVMATETFQNHEIASLNVVFLLPVVPDDALELHGTITAHVTRAGGDTMLRTSVHNPVLGRFDTVAELPTSATTQQTLTFAMQSLAHVSQEGFVRVQAIAEIAAGARAEFHVDHIGLSIVRRAESVVPTK